MDNQIKIGHFEQDGGLVNLPVGFIPDYIKLVDFSTNGNIDIFEWWREMERHLASGLQEGFSIKEGTTARLADAGGITAYSTGSQTPTIEEWTEARSTAATARTATAPGTYIKPTVANAADRGSIFECVTAGTGASTEPTWPDSDGENVTDNSVVWQKVNVSLQRGGYQGVIIAAAVAANNGTEMFYFAFRTVDSVDHGDVDGWTDGVDPNA